MYEFNLINEPHVPTQQRSWFNRVYSMHCEPEIDHNTARTKQLGSLQKQQFFIKH